jgi:hypothetical protein
MSFSLPYDHPSLVLGHIVPPTLLGLLDKIRSIQGRTDAALDRMHSLMAMRRSLTMTLSEMTSMGIDVTALEERIAELNQSIAQAASDYIGKRLANDMAIQAERDRILEIDLSNASESPLDFSKIEVKRQPLGSDNLQIDIQYFKHQGSEAPEGAVRARVEQMVRENTAGPSQQVSELSKKAGALVAQQQESHDLVGTLVITANAMHRSVAMLEPVRLDVTKSIDAWNASFGSPALRLNPDDPMSMVKLASQTRGDAVDKSLTLLTGAVYGSSFVGMIHLVRSKMSPSGLSNVDIAAIMERVRLSAAIKAESGGIGAEPSVLEDVRQMISDQGFTAHVSIIVHGALTTPGAKHVENLVDKSMQVPSRMPFPMAGAAIANAARSAQTAAQAEAGKVSGLATTLSTVDKSSATGIDLGTLFTAFDNYLAAITKDNAVGAPIGFYVKRISAAQIAREWLAQAEQKWRRDQSTGKNQTPPTTTK